jgi:hypothetical protein
MANDTAPKYVARLVDSSDASVGRSDVMDARYA